MYNVFEYIIILSLVVVDSGFPFISFCSMVILKLMLYSIAILKSHLVTRNERYETMVNII